MSMFSKVIEKPSSFFTAVFVMTILLVLMSFLDKGNRDRWLYIVIRVLCRVIWWGMLFFMIAMCLYSLIHDLFNK